MVSPVFTGGDNFAAANQGQLKRIAGPFYDRLGLVYPWQGGAAGPQDFSAVNAGQLKRTFAFDIQPAENRLSVEAAPSSIYPEGTYELDVTYASVSTNELIAGLFDAGGTAYGTEAVPVKRGHGTLKLYVTLTNPVPVPTARQWRVAMAPPGTGFGGAHTVALVSVLVDFDVESDLRRVLDQLPGKDMVAWDPASTSTVLSIADSLFIEDLRNVVLDSNPPVLGTPVAPYPADQTDGYAPGAAPYVAKDIAPFRFRYFNTEFIYGGKHNRTMRDYAAAHGFSIVAGTPGTNSMHLPSDIRWMVRGGWIRWNSFLGENGIPDGHFDELDRARAMRMVAEADALPTYRSHYDNIMVDLEHDKAKLSDLPKLAWYPSTGTPEEQAEFERRYYEGVSLSFISVIDTLRLKGWKNISLYSGGGGPQPFPRTWPKHGRWSNMADLVANPTNHWQWPRMGQPVYQHLDIINPSVYCFYWSSKNVPYTLANVDLNMQVLATEPVRKPVRPYYWVKLHGGGDGWRWWKHQPMADEDARAMCAFAFFTGTDGFVSWNSAFRRANDHIPPPLTAGKDVMLEAGFALTPEGGGIENLFVRYDALHIVSNDGARVWFQPIDKSKSEAALFGTGSEFPMYSLPVSELTPKLRIHTKPVASMIEGMALAKPFEYVLKHGEVKIDQPATVQSDSNAPIVRRVKLGPYHVIATYDARPVHRASAPRDVVLSDFDGREGHTLTLPCDEHVRFFVLREP